MVWVYGCVVVRWWADPVLPWHPRHGIVNHGGCICAVMNRGGLANPHTPVRTFSARQLTLLEEGLAPLCLFVMWEVEQGHQEEMDELKRQVTTKEKMFGPQQNHFPFWSVRVYSI